MIAYESATQTESIDLAKLTVLKIKPKIFNSTKSDLVLAEQLVKQRLDVYNAEQTAYNTDKKYVFGNKLHYESDLINFDKYYKQCIPELDSNGDKVLSYNCLCEINDFWSSKYDWKKQLIVVHDGGSCYSWRVGLSGPTLRLFSRRIMGWWVDKHMKESLIVQALQQRQPKPGLIVQMAVSAKYGES